MYPSDDREIDEEKLAENELTKEKLEILKSRLKRINHSLNNNEIVNQQGGEEEEEEEEEDEDEDEDEDNNGIIEQNKEIVDKNNNMTVHNPMPPSVLPSAASINIQNLRLKRFNSLNIIQKPASDKKSNETAAPVTASTVTPLTIESKPLVDNNNNNNNTIVPDLEDLETANEVNKNIKKSLIKYSHFDNQHQPQQQIHAVINDEDEIDDEDDVDDGDDYDQDIDDIAQELLNRSIFISSLDANSGSIVNSNLIKTTNKKLLLSSSSATSSAANNYYIQNLNLNDDSTSNNTTNNGNSRKYSKKGSLKYISSADSLVSRNNTSSKMLQSAISIQNNSSLDDLTSSSALMNNQKQYTNDNFKASDVNLNLTPAPLVATQLDDLTSINDNNNNITEEDKNELIQKDSADAISSYLQKHLNLIVSRSDEKDQQPQQQKSNYKRLPPKFGVLYANKASGNSGEVLQQKQNEAELGANEETTYSVIQNKTSKSHINLALQETGTKIPPSLHHSSYQYPTSTSQTSATTHLLNPLLFGRNPATSNTNQLTSSNTANRFEILMKS